MTNLTEQQRYAVKCNSKKILVKAGAGTGKTEVLTRRVIHILESDHNISLKDIAIITFTNKATEELRNRLNIALYNKWKNTGDSEQKNRFRYELESINMCTITTIHQFCKEILDTIGPINYSDINYSPNYLIKEGISNTILNIAIEETLVNFDKKGKELSYLTIMPVYELKEHIKKTYKYLKNKGLEIKEVTERTKKFSIIETGSISSLKKELAIILEEVHDKYNKLNINTLDIDHLLEYCAKILNRNETIREKIKSKYKHIFIDEFQDTSAHQTSIIKSICDDTSNAPSLFLVGDVKQSIYEFRGADVTSYLHVEDWIKSNGEIINLNVNFRSTPDLVQYVNVVFENISNTENTHYTFYSEPLKTSEENESYSIKNSHIWLLAENKSKQKEMLIDYLKKQLEKGIDLSQFAILTRRNLEAVEYNLLLQKHEIPSQLIGSGDYFNQREIIEILKYINYLINPTEITKNELIETLFFNNDITILNNFLKKLNEFNFKDLTPSQIIDLLYREVVVKTLVHPRRNQILANITKLKELNRKNNFKESMSLIYFKNWLESMINSHKDESQADTIEGDEKNKLLIMTIHKAKGLEFPSVILPDLDKEIGGNLLKPSIIYNDNTGLEFRYKNYHQPDTYVSSTNYSNAVDEFKKDYLSEELRVLYVALTRAEKELILLGSNNCPKNRICYQNWLMS